MDCGQTSLNLKVCLSLRLIIQERNLSQQLDWEETWALSWAWLSFSNRQIFLSFWIIFSVSGSKTNLSAVLSLKATPVPLSPLAGLEEPGSVLMDDQNDENDFADHFIFLPTLEVAGSPHWCKMRMATLRLQSDHLIILPTLLRWQQPGWWWKTSAQAKNHKLSL